MSQQDKAKQPWLPTPLWSKDRVWMFFFVLFLPLTAQGQTSGNNDILKPNLAFNKAYIAPTSIYGNNTPITFYYILSNTGTGAIGKKFTIQFYYSLTNKLTSSAVRVASTTHTLTILPKTNTRLQYHRFTLPPTLTHGTRFLFAKLDSANVIAESNESDNVAVAALKVTGQADLLFKAFKLNSTTPLQGGNVSVSYQIFNQGYAATSRAFPVELWYSVDGVLDRRKDLLFATRNITAIIHARGTYPSSGNATLTARLPSTVRAGRGYMFLVINGTRVLSENVYTNNMRSQYVTIKSDTDLKAEKIYLSTKYAFKGKSYLLTYVVRNDRNIAVSGVQVRLYYSYDSTITPGDMLLTTVTISQQIPPKTSLTQRVTLTLNTNIRSGEGYLGMYVDPSNQFIETDEANNTLSEKLEFLVDDDKDGYWYSKDCKSYLTTCDCNDSDRNIRPNAAETCNRRDDNCNGQIDENVKRSCYTGRAGTNGVGPCKSGSQVCISGTWGNCVGQIVPQPREICSNGKDDNCNGFIDEGCTCSGTQPCGSDVGACKKGYQVCRKNKWGACINEVKPVPEVCDNIDNDCDGVTDEHWPNKAKPCVVGIGGCRKTGYMICAADKKGLVCSAKAGTPTTEVCNNVDDDCDGQTDENLTRKCFTGSSGKADVGVCKSGVQNCFGGKFTGSCVGQILPSAEICDGLDNDCDGKVDNSSSCREPSPEPTKDGGSQEPTPEPPDSREKTPDTLPKDQTPPEPTSDVSPDAVTDNTPDKAVCAGCSASQGCRGKTCLSVCKCSPCAKGETCIDGSCQTDPCAGKTCPRGELCTPHDGKCTPNPCRNVTCPSGTSCREGQCHRSQCSSEPVPDGQEQGVPDNAQDRVISADKRPSDKPLVYDFQLDLPSNSNPGCDCSTASPGVSLFWSCFVLCLWFGIFRRRRGGVS